MPFPFSAFCRQTNLSTMVLRSLFTLLLLPIAVLGFAQTTVSYGLELYPNLSNRRQAIYYNIDPTKIDSLDKLEKGTFGYGLGAFWGVRGEKIGFQVGANYSVAGYQRVRSVLADGSPDKPAFAEYTEAFRTQQIEVPIGIKFYQELGDQDEFYFMFGALLNYSLQNELTTTLFADSGATEERKGDAPGDYRKFNIGFQAGLGWEHHFSDAFTMSLQPTFRFYFQGLLQNDPALQVNRNLYSLGLRATFRLDRRTEYVD